MDQRSKESLLKLFDIYRIVFWYDEKKNLREDFETLELEGITKVELNNNEFMLKYRLLKEEPDNKFLIYHEGKRPKDEDNWLLDLLQYQGIFHTDQSAIILSELNLDSKFHPLIETHITFFDSKVRLASLKRLLSGEESKEELLLKLLAICCSNSDDNLDTTLMALFDESAQGKDEKLKLIKRCNLESFLWEMIQRSYNYKSEEVGIKDFIYELFSSALATLSGERATLNNLSQLFLKRWQDSNTYSKSFEYYSNLYSDEYSLADKIITIDFKYLLESDYFRVIDQHIIRSILEEVKNKSSNDENVQKWIYERRTLYWKEHYKYHYDALSYASKFLNQIATLPISISTIEEGLKVYSSFLKEIDYLYRKYFISVDYSNSHSLFADLTKDIENYYNNHYLFKLSKQWDHILSTVNNWEATPFANQRNFYLRYVKQPFVDKNVKVVVVISDALRYEVGDELATTIRGQQGFDVTIEPMLANLPSYTQLGMASLLPNKELTIEENGSVKVDGFSSMGSSNRLAILKKALGEDVALLDAETLISMKVEESSKLIQSNKVIYVYHNEIDKAGDDKTSEEKVFNACESTLESLKTVVRKLSSSGISNIIITTDHGFIYQNNVLEDSDFVGLPVSTEGAFLNNRRYLVGKTLADNQPMHSFSSDQLKLGGDLTIQVPRGYNRLKVKGSGSRYVHGGASLQEVVLPVIKINKKKQSEVSNVSVTVLKGVSNKITSWQLSVTFYQEQPVTEKIKGLNLRVGLYTKEGKTISETKRLLFNFTSESPRDREIKVQLQLDNSPEAMKNQQVELRLEEAIANTNKWKHYYSYPYFLQRQIEPDF